MYTSYWQLERRPFEAGTDTAAYYPSETHQAALLKLRYSIENARGAAALVGASGGGKTLVARILADQLPSDLTPVIHLVYPRMATAELLAYLAAELAGGDDAAAGVTVGESVRAIEASVSRNAREGRHAVVIIDEAHLLEADALEALRLLLNFEVASRPALTLLLVGQTRLLSAVDRVPCLGERLGVRCLIRALAPEETFVYVEHRLRSAGAARSIFTHEALEAIHELSQGNPRQINRLCDLALLIGFAEERTEIEAADLSAAADELTLVAAE